MSDSATLIANERYKAIGSALFRLGSVSLVGLVAKLYVDQSLSIFTGGWLVATGFPFVLGWKVFSLLEKES